MIPLLLLLLAACQANDSIAEEDGNTKETNEMNEVVNNDENEKVEENNEPEVNYDLYDSIIDEYKAYDELTFEEADNKEFTHVRDGAIYFHADRSIYGGISAAYQDINGDGIDNLLIALRSLGPEDVTYRIIDIYTILDNEAHSLMDHGLSAYVGDVRTSNDLLEDGTMVQQTVANQGQLYGFVYELDEDELTYKETASYSDEEGNFDQVEAMLEEKQDLHTFKWEKLDTLGSVYDQTVADDFSYFHGEWESNAGDRISIDRAGRISFGSGYSDLELAESSEATLNESIISLTHSVESENEFPSSIVFHPKGVGVNIAEPLESDVSKERIVIYQQGAPSEEGVYSRVDE